MNRDLGLRSRCWLGLSGLMLAAPLAMAAAPQSVAEQPHVRAELLADVQVLRAGERFRASVRLEPEAGWHTYWINPGDSGLATRLEWNLPAGVEAGPLQWPFPERESLGPLTNYGYAHAHDLISRIQTAERPGSAVLPLRVQAEWLVCKEICIPGSAVLGLDIPYAEESIDSIHKASLDASQSRVPQREDWPARFAIEDKALRLHVPEEAVQGAKQVELFPLTPEILANADIPQLRRAEGGLWMQQALSEYFAGPPQSLEMVAVLDGQRAIQFSASPGPLPALPDPMPQSRAGAASAWLPALGLALLGGLLLNLMPCVFPVLSIKALALARDAGANGQQRRAHALLYTGGVLTGFVGLAAVLLALRGAGTAVGWGFQLQSPWLVGSLAYVMLALGLALHGYWQFGTRLMGLGQGLVDGGGAKGAYFTGLLACVVATPCTAPFMGAAMGYALTQPALLALSVFAALGLGMALPFLLLGWVPALASWLPRPGAWMERFKQAMAWPLYATAIWLLWVLGRQSGVDAMALVLLGALPLIVALRLWGSAMRTQALAMLMLILPMGSLALLPQLSTQPASEEVAESEAGDALWSAYSPERLQALRQDGQPVFVNLTADWCLSCKFNERVALDTPEVRQAFAQTGVTALRGDWTLRDPQITALLEAHGRSGVPLYLLYAGPTGRPPEILPQLLTPGRVVAALESTRSLSR